MPFGNFEDTLGGSSLLSEPHEELWRHPKLAVPWLQLNVVVLVGDKPTWRQFFIRAHGLEEARETLFSHHPELGDVFTTPVQQVYLSDEDREVLDSRYNGLLVAEHISEPPSPTEQPSL